MFMINDRVHAKAVELAPKAAVCYVIGELAGRLVSWMKPGISGSNSGLFAATTPFSLMLVSRAVDKLGIETLKKSTFKQAASLSLSFYALKLVGYTVSPWAIGAYVITSILLNSLVSQPEFRW